MKTRILSFILALALLLPALAGCGKSEDPPKPDGQTETEADYSWFSMPEETGKLMLYSPGNFHSALLNAAIDIFKQLYPEIEVSYTILGDDEFETRIRTEIPAGKGPDLVLMMDTTFPDIYKTMATGLFEDLNPYFGTDEEIALSEFVQPVMDVGLMDGKRYLAPLNYKLPILMTTQSILDELGMTAEELETCDGFCEGAVRFREKHPDSTLYFDTGGINPTLSDMIALYRSFGFNLINYETGEVDVDEALFRQCMDLAKLYYDPGYDTDEDAVWDIPYYGAGGGLHLKLFPYDSFSGDNYMSYVTSKTFLGADGEEPVMFLPSNQRDGVTAETVFGAAIPKGAANKSAAWKLLKILLSDEIQGGHDENNWNTSYFRVGYPVRLSATKAVMDHGEEMTPDGPEFDRFVELVQSPTDAVIVPEAYIRYLKQCMLPYVYGEKGWDDCWKSFMSTMELYKDE